MIGQTISHYRILEKLGAGGMGEVYLAEDTQLGRTVALKILPPEFASDAERMRRFVHEAKSASALNHPHVAHIYEIGEAGGVRFIAMEYVGGQTLASRIAGPPFDQAELLELALQIVDALGEAHSKHITHRDIKPANIMITPRGQAKVLDFGLAKLSRPEGSGPSSILNTESKTDPGVVMGTVQYMSPEQALGKNVDHRSDLFSLGVVLYQMTTSRLPFSGGTTSETIDRIVHAQPEAIARFNYGVSPELERIVRKCLEKDRDRRYQSAQDLWVDLSNLRRDCGPVQVSTGERTLPARRWGRWVLAATAVLVVAAVAAIYMLPRRGESIDSLAVLPFVNTGADPDTEYLSEGITETLINNLSQIPELRVIARSTVFAYKGRNVDPRQAGSDLKVGAILTGKVSQRGDTLFVQAELVDVREGLQLWGQQYNRKKSDLLAIQEEISREISEKLRLKLTPEKTERVARRPTDNQQAFDLYLRARFLWNKGTEDATNRAIELFQQALAIDPDYALAWAGLADCYAWLTDTFRAPQETMPKAKAAIDKALALNENLAEAHSALGIVKLWYELDYPAARKEFERAIELNPNYSTARDAYGWYLSASGQLQKAEAQYERAQQLDPLSLISKVDAAMPMYFGRDYDRSLAQVRRALDLEPNFFLAHYVLGMNCVEKGEFDKAIAAFERCYQLEKQPWMLAGIGFGYARAGKKQRAMQVISELENWSKIRHVSAGDIALVYVGLADKERALEWLEKAYQGRSQWMLFLKMGPMFDGLRADPRFQDLVRRVGFDR